MSMSSTSTMRMAKSCACILTRDEIMVGADQLMIAVLLKAATGVGALMPVVSMYQYDGAKLSQALPRDGLSKGSAKIRALQPITEPSWLASASCICSLSHSSGLFLP
jgi:hypothetical protein